MNVNERFALGRVGHVERVETDGTSTVQAKTMAARNDEETTLVDLEI